MNLYDILGLSTNRELAIATWLILFIILTDILSIYNKDLRKSICDFFKTLLSKPLRILIITIVIYFAVVTYLFSILSFKKNTLLATMVGFVLGCGYAVLKFLLDNRLRTKEEAEKYLGIPVFAELPEV